MTDLDQVREFWESNPLWTGESGHEVGSIDFYEEHRQVYLADCFAGCFDIRFLPPPRQQGQSMKILDLGCGIGFWVCEFAMRGLTNLVAADLTRQALELTQKRLDVYKLSANLAQENAENLSYHEDTFDHVNCQGVLHHTPNPAAAIDEIARVLKPGGTASISVYYRNPILKMWPFFCWLGMPLAKLGGGLKGRGRENIFLQSDVDEIVRLYDGSQNPIGKSFTKRQFLGLLERRLVVKECYLHFFPARALPFTIPRAFHHWLDKHLGFMIYATVYKSCVE